MKLFSLVVALISTHTSDLYFYQSDRLTWSECLLLKEDFLRSNPNALYADAFCMDQELANQRITLKK